jgi:hypothetical protein
MLLHLPIAFLATLSPIPVSNTVPTFDIVRACRFEAGSIVDSDRCSRDEVIALRQLQQGWTKFAGADKKTCLGETTIGGFASYVELLTCLEMASGVRKEDLNPPDPGTGTESSPLQLAQPGVTVGVGTNPPTAVNKGARL